MKYLLVLVLAGCTTSTGVVKISDDTYMLGMQTPSEGSGSAMKVRVYQQANEFCAKQGKKFARVSDSGADAGWTGASAEVQFRCQ